MIEIGELNLSVYGLNKEQGNALGSRVAEIVAESIPDFSGNFHIPELKIKLQADLNNDTELLADRIADQIIRKIKLSTPG